MSVELVRIPTSDGLVLDGALHNGDAIATSVVLYLHGKGGAFYTGPGRYIPESPEMRDVPCAHLAINMRMHDLGFSRHNAPDRPMMTNTPPFPVSAGGGMWERLSEGILDVQAAVKWLRENGTQKVFVSGKSSGGFFATQYASTDPTIAGVIVMSPVHTHRMPFPTWFASDAEKDEVIQSARETVARGEGYRLIPLPQWYYAISAASLVERADEPENIWIDWMPSLSGPLLMFYGDLEVDDVGVWQDGFTKSPSARKRLVVLQGNDHSYIGGERTVCVEMSQFVRDVLDNAGGW
jgi:pimeloyl-ACP methyl ester carboxylesterase